MLASRGMTYVPSSDVPGDLCKPPANGTKFSVSKAESGRPYEG